MLDRRRFLGFTAAGLATTTWPVAGRSDSSLKILILGGTGFLGPHTVSRAVERGHEMTLFNRGRTNSHLFPDLEKLRGDRDGDLEALKNRSWDVVIDTSGYVPRLVGDSARLLAPNVKQYIFISTISVYADPSVKGMDESAPLGTIEDPTVEEITGVSYGPLKALSEQAAEDALPGRTCIIRPGLIAGPGDRTDRFTYWPVRVARGGDVLAPGGPEEFTQVIDVRDLANFIIYAAEQNHTDTFNADRPAESLTMGGLMTACKEASGSDARFHWADAQWLEANNVQAWSHMPVWLPDSGGFAAMGEISTERAEKAGLTIRPLVETARDTLEWFRQQPEERQGKLRAGLEASREAELVELLKTG